MLPFTYSLVPHYIYIFFSLCFAANPPSSCLIVFHCYNKHVTWISLYIRDTMRELASEVGNFSRTSLLISSMVLLSSLHFLLAFFFHIIAVLITWNLLNLINLPFFCVEKWKINWALIYLAGESTYLWPGVWKTVIRDFSWLPFNWRKPFSYFVSFVSFRLFIRWFFCLFCIESETIWLDNNIL